jgi:hypothetical protein
MILVYAWVANRAGCEHGSPTTALNNTKKTVLLRPCHGSNYLTIISCNRRAIAETLGKRSCNGLGIEATPKQRSCNGRTTSVQRPRHRSNSRATDVKRSGHRSNGQATVMQVPCHRIIYRATAKLRPCHRSYSPFTSYPPGRSHVLARSSGVPCANEHLLPNGHRSVFSQSRHSTNDVFS